jgi:hypothetical protein
LENLSVLAEGVAGMMFVYWDSMAHGAFSAEANKEYEHAAWAIHQMAEKLDLEFKNNIQEMYEAQKESSE